MSKIRVEPTQFKVERWIDMEDIASKTMRIEAIRFGTNQRDQEEVIFVGSVEDTNEVIGVSNASWTLVAQGRKLKKSLPLSATFTREPPPIYYRLTAPIGEDGEPAELPFGN